MAIEHQAEKWFRMSDEVWARHANPWSVWTRYGCLPLLALAIWSRQWWGGWSLLPVLLVVIWIYYNPRIFPRPVTTRRWASRAVLGERVWLMHPRNELPGHHLVAIAWLKALTGVGFAISVWGLWSLHPWLTIIGVVLTIVGKTWFLDRMVWLYLDMQTSRTVYQEWDY